LGVECGEILTVVQALLEWGLNTAAIDKYQQQGFGIITNEKQREQAALRCNNDLETYYTEKLTLCQLSNKTHKNKVGFLVKALQEDWQESKKTTKTTEVKKTATANESNNKQTEAQLRELKKRVTLTKQVIFDEIIASDTEGYLKIFEEVKEQSGSMKNTVFPTHLSPIDIFKKNGMAANLLKIRLEELYPKRFEEIFNLP
jgi:hypothetical protein